MVTTYFCSRPKVETLLYILTLIIWSCFRATPLPQSKLGAASLKVMAEHVLGSRCGSAIGCGDSGQIPSAVPCAMGCGVGVGDGRKYILQTQEVTRVTSHMLPRGSRLT